jgi:hypothetical protein
MPGNQIPKKAIHGFGVPERTGDRLWVVQGDVDALRGKHPDRAEAGKPAAARFAAVPAASRSHRQGPLAGVAVEAGNRRSLNPGVLAAQKGGTGIVEVFSKADLPLAFLIHDKWYLSKSTGRYPDKAVCRSDAVD